MAAFGSGESWGRSGNLPRISAASLDPDIPVRSLLARHLTAAFGLKPVTARTLVEAERILPVIDRLDETGTPGYGSQAARALQPRDDLPGHFPSRALGAAAL
ncbi:hypothetical protein ACIBQ1_01990 [Nonomuraea sp. NPDC050153]|uniref:hypothetical protein n=1 Tax=Nonomuraea sp. NPDC050153 TaxID=3364359 RepID=UPI0037968A88